jgi:hypothetical protein
MKVDEWNPFFFKSSPFFVSMATAAKFGFQVEFQ